MRSQEKNMNDLRNEKSRKNTNDLNEKSRKNTNDLNEKSRKKHE